MTPIPATGGETFRGLRRPCALIALLLSATAGVAEAANICAAKGAPGQWSTASVAGAASTRAEALRANGIGIMRLGRSFVMPAAYRKYSYVVVGRADAKKAAALPGTSLVYMSGTTVPASFNTGVYHTRAAANGWLLKDGNGAFVVREDLHDYFLGDVGDRNYQQVWLNNVLKFLRATKVDGVFVDDVVADIAAWSTGEVYPAKYPSGEAWENAMASFIEFVGPALKRSGFYVLVNAIKRGEDDVRSNDGTFVAEWWQRIGSSVSGLMTEYWLQNPNNVDQLRAEGPEWFNNASGWTRLVSVAQSMGRDFFGLTYGTPASERTMRYGKASFLLDWNGRGGAFLFHSDSPDPAHPAWTIDLGRPLRPKIQLAPGVWRRRFEHGIVVVNSTAAPATVRVAGVLRTIDSTDAVLATL